MKKNTILLLICILIFSQCSKNEYFEQKSENQNSTENSDISKKSSNVKGDISINWLNPVYKNKAVTFSGTQISSIKTLIFSIDGYLIKTLTNVSAAFSFNYTFSSSGLNRKMVVLGKDINNNTISTLNTTITVFETSTPAIPNLVLMYHEITSNPTYSSDVSINNFREQMQWLKNNGYTTISTDDLFMGTLPAKSVMITFDDGYEGNYNNAKPILESLNMKADFFVHTDYVGVPSTTSWNHMTWTQLRTLDASTLFSVNSHTKTHPHLTQITAAQLTTEVTVSKQKLETELGGVRNYFAYPFGDYNANVISASQSAGYTICFAVEDKGLFGKPRKFSIPRKGIGKDITTIQAFKTRIGI